MSIAFVALEGPDDFRDNNLVDFTLSNVLIRRNSNTKTIARISRGRSRAQRSDDHKESEIGTKRCIIMRHNSINI